MSGHVLQSNRRASDSLPPLQVVASWPRGWEGAVRSAGNNYSAWFSLGSAANFALPPHSPTHTRAHTRTHSHLIYIICAGFCLAFALLSRRLLLLLILFTCPPGGFISLLLQQSIVLCVGVSLYVCVCVCPVSFVLAVVAAIQPLNSVVLAFVTLCNHIFVVSTSSSSGSSSSI